MKRKAFWGLLLIVIGLLLLLQALGIISGNFWGYFWPVVLILIGLSFVFSKK